MAVSLAGRAGALLQAWKAYHDLLVTAAPRGDLGQFCAQLQQEGLSGEAGLDALENLMQSTTGKDLTSSEMAALYCLAHLVARHDGRKFVTKAAAIRAWRVVLRGRFRRLEDWCTFVAAAPTAMISEDLWRQVLDFSRTIYEDLSNYDTNGAWPTLIDEYVSSRRSQASSLVNCDGTNSEVSRCTEAVLPLSVPARPGSKRHLPRDDEEADALASRLESLRPSCDGELSHGGSQNCTARRMVHEAKRCRLQLDAVAQTYRLNHLPEGRYSTQGVAMCAQRQAAEVLRSCNQLC